jgi:GAF domain-containing protein
MAENTSQPRYQSPPSELLRYTLAGVLFGALFPALATLFKVAALGLPFGPASILQAQLSEPLLWVIDTAPFVLGIMAAIAGRRQDLAQTLNLALQQREDEVRLSGATLAQRVEERTAELTRSNDQRRRRAAQLQAVADVARTIASLQDLDRLLASITTLISEQFNYYHVGIFLLDESREHAILRAANSAGGQKMLARGHQLPVEATSIVGYVAIFGKARVASDVGTDTVYSSSPDLPETRSEVALPLIVGSRAIGVLDVQIREAAEFSQDDLEVLGTLAYQVAVAIENARLFDETRAALAEAQNASQQYLGHAWARFNQPRPALGYRSDGGRAVKLASALQGPAVTGAITTGELTGTERSEQSGASFALPLKLRDQVIGVLHVQSKDTTREWTADEIAIARAAADRAALALENARLLADSQKRAAKEKIISEATAHISSALNIENILHTTTNELARALGSTEIILQLSPDETE